MSQKIWWTVVQRALFLGLLVGLGWAARRSVLAEEPVVVDFRNFIPGVLDAPVFDADGVTRLEGGGRGDFFAQLYSSTNGPTAMQPTGPATLFGQGTNAGYWEPITVSLSAKYNVKLGQRIWVQAQTWEAIRTFPLDSTPGFFARSEVFSFVVTNPVVQLTGLKPMSFVPLELRVRTQGAQVVLVWLNFGAAEYWLEATTNLSSPIKWQKVAVVPYSGDVRIYDWLSVTNTISRSNVFYRVRHLRWSEVGPP